MGISRANEQSGLVYLRRKWLTFVDRLPLIARTLPFFLFVQKAESMRSRSRSDWGGRTGIADERTTRGRNQDRERVAGGQEYELEYFARKHGITAEQARHPWRPPVLRPAVSLVSFDPAGPSNR